MKGTPLYSLKGHFEVERSSSYAFSNYDICDIYTRDSVNHSQEHNTKAYACAIVDSGILYEQSNLTGVNYQDGSECIDKYSRANLHGEFVFEIIKNNCKIKNEDILILKSIDGESGNSIDILEALYFIKHNNVNYVNMSIAFNNRQLQYVLEGLISDNTKYCFTLNNYENTDSLYIDRKNVYYVYDSNQMDERYIDSLQCTCVKIDMEALRRSDEMIDMKGNSFATAKYTNLCLRKETK